MKSQTATGNTLLLKARALLGIDTSNKDIIDKLPTKKDIKNKKDKNLCHLLTESKKARLLKRS
jgi:hypothetical protein